MEKSIQDLNYYYGRDGLQESINDPPQVPLITGHVKKKGQESLLEAPAGACKGVLFIGCP